MASGSNNLPAVNGAPNVAGTTTNNVVTLPHRAEPTTPSEKAISFVKRHPVLTVAGGVAFGLAVSALMPRSFGRKIAGRAYRLAETGAAAALSLGHEALDKAEDGGALARKKAALIASQAEKLSEKAVARAERLGVAALGTAGVWGHAAAERAERLGHVAAVRAEHFGERASERLGHLSDKALSQSTKLLGYPKAPPSLLDRVLGRA